MQRVKQGDTVEVIAGKDKGERGEVMRVIKKTNRVLVNGVNMVKKHEKPRPGPSGQQIDGQIVDREAALHLSNVMLVCPKCDERTRVNYRKTEDDYKTRVCKKCGQDMDV